MQIARVFRQLQRFDWLLLLATLVLFAFGLAAIYSVELSRESSDFIFVRKQLIAFALGFILLLVAANANYLQLRNYARIFYLVCLGLLAGVLIFGTEIRGTTGWFVLFGVSFQPVELMKVALAAELARYFGEHARRKFGWREVAGSGILVAAPVVLAAMQPDLGSAALLIGMWLVVIFFAGIGPRHVLALASVLLATGLISWFFLLQPYQIERIKVFLDPSLDPLESGYNITQAKIAIGSGQFLGRGLGFGSQSQLKFLPESQTDFVFAVIAEELGFVGVILILATMSVVLWRILWVSFHARDHFSSFLAIAIFGSLFVQMLVNIGVNLAILPATGVVLPLMSYGGSSLVISLLMIGVIESIVVRIRPADLRAASWYN